MYIKILNEMRNYPRVREILDHEVFLEMDRYRHHGDISCLRHTISVAELTYLISKKRGLDFISATRAALLHDLYLYDWHNEGPRLHGFRHPAISLRNARKHFELNKIESDAILRHMWPLTPTPPRYKESILVSYADKASTFRDYRESFQNNINGGEAELRLLHL